MDTIVCKFGGTSIGTAQRMLQVHKIISLLHSSSHNVIVVLSAMSCVDKSFGTTNKLLLAADHVLIPNSSKYLDIINELEAQHLATAKEAITGSSHILDSVCSDIRAYCEKLRSFMVAAEIIEELSPRSKDVIVSTGEKLSARILAGVLLDYGLPAQFFSLDKVVVEKFEREAIDQSFYDYVVGEFKLIFNDCDASIRTIPVVTGFFGPVPGSLLHSIGRGYTDLTAALIAVATGAQELQIYKEVDGIFSADPRKVPSAKLLPSISPEEAAELTYYGSEVIHPFTMEQVIRAKIPIRIKNTFNPTGNGTLILPNAKPLPSLNVQLPSPIGIAGGSVEKGMHARAVTLKDKICVLNIRSNRKSVSHGFFSQIFSILDKHNITVDLISTSQVHISMALPQAPSARVLAQLERYGDVCLVPDMAIISLVGSMRNMVGIAGRMLSILAKNRINIEMISQGASEINISCVIEGRKSEAGLRCIHDDCVEH